MTTRIRGPARAQLIRVTALSVGIATTTAWAPGPATLECSASVIPPSRADGAVLSASTAGELLIFDEQSTSPELRVVSTQGDSVATWPVDNPPGVTTPLSWSPDGTLVAWDGLTDEDGSRTSRITVLDLSSGEVSRVHQPSSAAADFFPTWVDESGIEFLRRPIDIEVDDPGVERVRLDLASGRETATPTELAHTDLGPQHGAVVGDFYLVSVITESGTEIVAIDGHGELLSMGSIDLPVAAVSETSRDHEQAVVVSYEWDASEVGPTTLIAATDEPVVADDLHAVAASFDQTGDRVIAIVPQAAGTSDARAVVTLWDPGTDRTCAIAELDILATGIRWTQGGEIVAWSRDEWQVVELDPDSFALGPDASGQADDRDDVTQRPSFRNLG